MRTKAKWLAAVVILLCGGSEVGASEPCGIYARIEEISLGPSEDQPTWILIKGDFLDVETNDRQYGTPARGYTCFTLEKGDADQNGATTSQAPATDRYKEKCRMEWDDLKSLVAAKGKGRAYVAFGSAFSEPFRRSPEVRTTAEAAQQHPTPYPIHHGLTRLRIPKPREAGTVPEGPGGQNPVLVLQEYQSSKDMKDGASP